jgi:hypothetical protein
MPFSPSQHRWQRTANNIDDRDTDMYNLRWPEQEMDFTTYRTTQIPTISDIGSAGSTHQHYLHANAMCGKPTPGSTSPVQIFNTGPFDFSEIVAMDSETVSPLEISSASSVRTDSSISPEGESQHQTLTTYQRSQPMDERLCPLITGDTDTCEPSRCGPDAPCMNFTSLPPIEECASAPCITMPENTVPVSSTSPSAARMSARVRRPLVNESQNTSRDPPGAGDRRGYPSTRRAHPTSASSQPSKKTANGKLDKKQRAKQAHSLVEKKYRENLNTKLSQLYTTLQNAHYGPHRFVSDSEVDPDELNDDGDVPISILDNEPARAVSSLPKFRKSEVLDNAMSYVNQTEVEMRHMETEILRLSDRIQQLEKLAKCQSDDCSMMKRLVQLPVRAPS